MNQNHQTQIESQRIVQHEDEIELIDILRVIWKWKYFILAGTIACGLIAAILSFSFPKIYRTSMSIQPGIVSIDHLGRKIYVDTVENVKTIIESNALIAKISKNLQGKQNKISLKQVIFKVSTPKNSEIINVSYETNNIDFGTNILEALFEALRNKYNEQVKYYQEEYDNEIKSIKLELFSFEAESAAFKQRTKNTQERIRELESLIHNITKANIKLIRERDGTIMKNKKEDRGLLVAFHNNTIQQNLLMANQCRNDIREYLYKIEQDGVQENIRQSEQKDLSERIRALEFKKGTVQNIQLLKPPTVTDRPIRPKIKLNIILSLAAGFFFFIFLSFFLEYLKRQKNT